MHRGQKKHKRDKKNDMRDNMKYDKRDKKTCGTKKMTNGTTKHGTEQKYLDRNKGPEVWTPKPRKGKGAKSEGPKGEGPERAGARKGIGPKGRGPEGGSPKISLFFFTLWGLLVELWPGFEAVDHQYGLEAAGFADTFCSAVLMLLTVSILPLTVSSVSARNCCVTS